MHWSAPAFNWNHQCADCHSTGLRKGYDAAADAFASTFAEVSVSCEACHGPAAAHVEWQQRQRHFWSRLRAGPRP
ncbi:MAG TPA: multiheme c-type cytochrome, partial [Pseudomonadales bacterium]|nr:multiheme c-type cytochrome [Pseudomonadales bacterium]